MPGRLAARFFCSPGKDPTLLITLAPDLDRATSDLGWTSLTPIQDLAIPHLRAGRDLFAQAQTGTGKTGAFALPILERIDGRAAAPFALVIVPTRELCAPFAAEFQALGRHRSARIVALYGGVGYRDQEIALRRGAHVAVATPGRLLDLVARRTCDLSKVRVLILDEADRLLDLGFAPDIARIVALLSGPRQTALFSATLTAEVRAIAQRYTKNPEFVAVKPETPTVDAIDQAWIDLPENADTYVHRVGRTGRAGRRGIAYTFVNETQRKDFEDIRRLAKVPFRRERLSLPATAPLGQAKPGSPTAAGRRIAHTRRWP